jgi:hypothetical protein
LRTLPKGIITSICLKEVIPIFRNGQIKWFVVGERVLLMAIHNLYPLTGMNPDVAVAYITLTAGASACADKWSSAILKMLF